MNTAVTQATQDLLKLILDSLSEDKAEDIVSIDLKDKTDFADFMVIATGRSSRHVVSIADKLIFKLKGMGLEGFHVEGKQKGDWILVDAKDIIINIFRDEIRKVYDIEKIWNFKIESPIEKQD